MLDSMGRESGQVETDLNKLPQSNFELDCTRSGNKASCKACEAKTENCETVQLIRENDQWKVDIQKEQNVPQK